MNIDVYAEIFRNKNKEISSREKLFFEEMIKRLELFNSRAKKDEEESRNSVEMGQKGTKGGTSPPMNCWKIMTRLWTRSAEKHYRKISGVQLMPSWVLITQRGYSPQALSPILSRFETWKTATRRVFDYIEFNNLGTRLVMGPLFRATSSRIFIRKSLSLKERFFFFFFGNRCRNKFYFQQLWKYTIS